MHPVAQGLTIHAAEPRRLGPRMAFENQRQSQQAADLSPVAASAAERTKLRARLVPRRDLQPRAHQSRPNAIRHTAALSSNSASRGIHKSINPREDWEKGVANSTQPTDKGTIPAATRQNQR